MVEKPDVIVLDIMLPGMDGWQVCQEIRRFSQVPIIMVTTEKDPSKIAEVLQLGVTAVCDKSFPPEIVGKILNQLEKTS